MKVTHEELLYRVTERAAMNAQNLKQKDRQRRNMVTDIYGVEYTRQGDANNPAVFYIPVSPASAYLERFSFKLIIQPFVSSVGAGTGSAVVNVKDRSLSISNNNITPNPHDHATDPHTHNLVSGISLTPTTASDFRVSIEGIDVTPYLMAQYGEWIDGEGVWPSLSIDEDYDILEVASDFEAEGRSDDVNKLVRSGYKPVTITSSAPFQVTMVVWVRFSHVNR